MRDYKFFGLLILLPIVLVLTYFVCLFAAVKPHSEPAPITHEILVCDTADQIKRVAELSLQDNVNAVAQTNREYAGKGINGTLPCSVGVFTFQELEVTGTVDTPLGMLDLTRVRVLGWEDAAGTHHVEPYEQYVLLSPVHKPV